MMERTFACVILIVLVSSAACAAEETEREKAAIASAEAWLALVDGGKYRESWERAAGYFRQAVGADQFAQALKGVREPLGQAVSRKVKSATYATTLPGAPDGHYVVIEFDTSFENRKPAVETVTPMLDSDGAWRVAGYFIR